MSKGLMLILLLVDLTNRAASHRFLQSSQLHDCNRHVQVVPVAKFAVSELQQPAGLGHRMVHPYWR